MKPLVAAIQGLYRQGGWLSFRGGARRTITLTISSDTGSLYNIRTQAGNPTDVVDVILTINSALFVKFGMDTGAGWISGSTIKVVNKADVWGIAGAGGDGGKVFSDHVGAPTAGGDGGHAFNLQYPVSIDNGSGFFRGGAGGGGGGGAESANNPPLDFAAQAAGGGGGGGRGYNNASGGAFGFTATPPGGNSNAGNPGNSAALGTGGTGGHDAINRFGGNGGNGGDSAAAGLPGGDGDINASFRTLGTPGGAAGFAIKQNGFALTWIAGSGNVAGLVG